MVEEDAKIEIEWALKQLQALELIACSKDGTKFCLTDKGRERAIGLLRKIPIDERILIALHSADSLHAVFDQYPD